MAKVGIVTGSRGAQDPPGTARGETSRRAAPDPAASAKPGPGADPRQPPPLPYEQARDQLTELVKRLEAGGLTLEQSLELWERGERLADICAEWLEGARARLATAIAQRGDGPADAAAPF